MINIKKEFPIFKNNSLTYLDNAATTHKPKILLDSLSDYYYNYNSNVGRGLYNLAYLSEQKYLESKQVIADFFNSKTENIIYTSGATESINMIAHIYSANISKKYIVLSILEHHANVLVWLELAKKNNLLIYWIKSKEEINNPDIIPEDIKKNIGIISITHVSNVTGEIVPIDTWIKFSKKINSIIAIDGSQGVTSEIINLNNSSPDFYYFSAHKMYGPMGLGVLFIGDKFKNNKPYKLGGGIVDDVTENEYSLVNNFLQFEAGTPNVANAFAFSKVLSFLKKNWEFHMLKNKENGLILDKKLSNIGIKSLSFFNLPKTFISSFILDNIHSHDVGSFLANDNIAVRVGKHCAYPLHSALKINSSIRVSLGIYNNKKDINKLINSLIKIKKFWENKNGL